MPKHNRLVHLPTADGTMTLKQILNEHGITEECIDSDADIIRHVKEWLERKRQYIDKWYNSECSPEHSLLTELLKELNDSEAEK